VLLQTSGSWHAVTGCVFDQKVCLIPKRSVTKSCCEARRTGDLFQRDDLPSPHSGSRDGRGKVEFLRWKLSDYITVQVEPVSPRRNKLQYGSGVSALRICPTTLIGTKKVSCNMWSTPLRTSGSIGTVRCLPRAGRPYLLFGLVQVAPKRLLRQPAHGDLP
jgi:hypothetical protein